MPEGDTVNTLDNATQDQFLNEAVNADCLLVSACMRINQDMLGAALVVKKTGGLKNNLNSIIRYTI